MEDFVTFNLAKKLREKGFKDNCIGYYDYEGEFHYNYESAISNKEIYFCHNKYDNIWHRDLVDAPTISQVLKWLRKEKEIYLEIVIVIDTEYMCDIYKVNPRPIECLGSTEYFKTPEQAALAGIEYALDNLP